MTVIKKLSSWAQEQNGGDSGKKISEKQNNKIT